ncbi:PHP domain-containing protein [Halorientalis pallida]|uniref:PHP domain-containing protein n=1 Tax=Halorientalis pallida TaxID=2479928 RepID=A0A498KZ88_9EURY|nr:PHP domain-containing protein [Halorientalis pallida]RXK50608.1 PHP domain-containing protein [Halorientalis pallida]
MVVADLHVHTTRSDGTLTLEAVPEAARSAGVEVVALTDHDRMQPALDAPVTEREGITVVHGIELRVDAGDLRVDLLGYGVDPTPALTELVEAIQRDRAARGRAIVECVEDRLGVALGVEPRPGLGRPHIARAVEESPADYDYQDAFDHLIGDDCPCYVARDIPTFEHGREVLTEACGVVGLAHPLRYEDPDAALDLTADLDAVERHYPYAHDADPTPVDRAIEAHDLFATGGSDAHDEQLGRAGLDRAATERLLAAL